VAPGLDFSDIDDIRRCVEHCNQLPVQPRHPYAGDLVYTSFSGSHQDAIKKALAARRDSDVWEVPYLPVDPKDLGRSYDAVIRVNSQSGKGGIAYLLEQEYGLELPRRLQIEFSRAVQAVTDDTGKEVTAAQIKAIFDAEYGLASPGVAQASIGGHSDGQVTVRAQLLAADGSRQPIGGMGNGPIDAFVAALQAHLRVPIRVLDYHEHAITGGADASAAAYIELRVGERTAFGVGIDHSITTASFKAIVSGVRRAQAGAAVHLPVADPA
jgi:2-isopropylmalate synthase